MKADFLLVVCFATLVFYSFAIFCLSSKCELPNGCHIVPWDMLDQWSGNEILRTSDKRSVQCVVESSEYRFYFDSWLAKNQSERCTWRNFDNFLELRFAKKRNIILGPQFDFQGLIAFMLWHFYGFSLRFTNLNGFEVDIGIDSISKNSDYLNSTSFTFEFINTRFDFYTNGRLIRSCSDIRNINETKSIFQVNAAIESSLFILLNVNSRDRCVLWFFEILQLK